ncbi:MAG: aminotransferase class V-fold PLP-dependent enzyme [Clostridiales bacterium]|nr:aminotransferase class V-fold PLP-dependent enzyme [Clostridiales bacterium]
MCSGVKLPVERLAAMCRIYGILFCVDAAQTAGVVPISLENSCIDFLCTAGHKGLYGPVGTGLLVINTEKTPDSIIQGGTGSESSNKSQPLILPDKYESGTPNLPGIAGLNEGIKFVLNKGVADIEKYEMRLTRYLYDKLKKISGVILYTKRPEIDNSVSVVSFNIKGLASETVAAILSDKYDIALRAGLHCAPLAHESFNTENSGTVRAVISVFNSYEQIYRLVYSVKEIIKIGKKGCN